MKDALYLTIELPTNITLENLKRAEHAMLLLDNLLNSAAGVDVSEQMVRQAYAAWAGSRMDNPVWFNQWEFQDAMKTGHSLMQPLIAALEEDKKHHISQCPWRATSENIPVPSVILEGGRYEHLPNNCRHKTVVESTMPKRAKSPWRGRGPDPR